jgi:hypothetical protein
MTRAGEMDRTITINRATETISNSGAVALAFTPIATMRAKLVEISTADMLRNAGGISEAALIFATHWIDGVTVADQIGYGAASFTIKSIREIGRRKGLEFTVEAIQ